VDLGPIGTSDLRLADAQVRESNRRGGRRFQRQARVVIEDDEVRTLGGACPLDRRRLTARAEEDPPTRDVIERLGAGPLGGRTGPESEGQADDRRQQAGAATFRSWQRSSCRRA
jgi:hypothetical protein